MPVYVMKVPWGPPFGQTLAGDVLTALQMPPGRETSAGREMSAEPGEKEKAPFH